MKFPAILLLLLSILEPITSQNILSDSILNEIQNNIIIFRIRNSAFLSISKYGTIDAIRPLFSKHLLDPKEKLLLTYEIKDDLKYPQNGYDIFIVSNPGHSIISGNVVQTTSALDFNLKLSEKFLIAYNAIERDIKYLGGEFYKSIICPDFPQGLDSIPFILQLKYFHYDLTEITLKHTRSTKYIYSAFSKSLEKRLRFKIDREYLDYIELVE
ncbi:MAG: hypothetical protein IPL46_18005 [Saprospiraceae bacterium]|nr:hypothetical protein [Saprospiraceae bacterium]